MLEASRSYARAHHMSLNSLIRKLLAQTVLPASDNWLDEMFEMMDQAKGDSRGQKWSREELYDV